MRAGIANNIADVFTGSADAAAGPASSSDRRREAILAAVANTSRVPNTCVLGPPVVDS